MHSAGIAGCDGALRRLIGRHTLEVTQVRLDGALVARLLTLGPQGYDLAHEDACLACLGRFQMRFEREGILLLSGDAEPACQLVEQLKRSLLRCVAVGRRL